MSKLPNQLEANQPQAPFSLPNLPYNKDALAPHYSPEAFDYHHGKHHQAYVTNLNKLAETNAELQNKSLETIISESAGQVDKMGIFNNAAQIWNHSFFWHCMQPQGGGKPSGALLAQIEKDFGSYDAFAEQFKANGVGQFGSGWVWLVMDNGALKVVKTANAELPLSKNQHAILTADVWEHAYYIDFRNRRPDYLAVFLEHLVSWDFAARNFAQAQQA